MTAVAYRYLILTPLPAVDDGGFLSFEVRYFSAGTLATDGREFYGARNRLNENTIKSLFEHI